MSKRKIALFVLLILVAAGWNYRPNFNRPRGVKLTLSTISLIPTYFKAGNSTSGATIHGLANKNYTHMQILNDTKYPLSIVTSEDDLTAPHFLSTEKLFVLSSATNTWDDISIYDSVYIMTENAQSATEGTIYIEFW